MGFTDIDGRCYYYGDFKLNWFRAIEFCHSFGSQVSLACIETRQEAANGCRRTDRQTERRSLQLRIRNSANASCCHLLNV